MGKENVELIYKCSLQTVMDGNWKNEIRKTNVIKRQAERSKYRKFKIRKFQKLS